MTPLTDQCKSHSSIKVYTHFPMQIADSIEFVCIYTYRTTRKPHYLHAITFYTPLIIHVADGSVTFRVGFDDGLETVSFIDLNVCRIFHSSSLCS